VLTHNNAHTLIVKEREILGNFIENFVYAELLKHGTYAKKSTKIYHYRDGNHEVDLVYSILGFVWKSVNHKLQGSRDKNMVGSISSNTKNS